MSGAMATQPPVTTSPTGRLRQARVSQCDRNVAIWTHLSPLLGAPLLGPLSLVIPVVMWLARKDASPFVDDHGREVVNFYISFTLLHLLLAVTVIGWLALPVIWIVGIIAVIRGAVAAGANEYFRYPMTIRFIS